MFNGKSIFEEKSKNYENLDNENYISKQFHFDHCFFKHGINFDRSKNEKKIAVKIIYHLNEQKKKTFFYFF